MALQPEQALHLSKFWLFKAYHHLIHHFTNSLLEYENIFNGEIVRERQLHNRGIIYHLSQVGSYCWEPSSSQKSSNVSIIPVCRTHFAANTWFPLIFWSFASWLFSSTSFTFLKGCWHSGPLPLPSRYCAGFHGFDSLLILTTTRHSSSPLIVITLGDFEQPGTGTRLGLGQK